MRLTALKHRRTIEKLSLRWLANMARKYGAQERYQRRQRDTRGMVRISIWIPEEARDRVLKMAEKLRRLAKHED